MKMIAIILTNVNCKSMIVVKKATKVLIVMIMMEVSTVIVYLDFICLILVDVKIPTNVMKDRSHDDTHGIQL